MNRFVISDTHFGHANICKFTDEFGVKQRDWDNVSEMDEYIIARWNSIVSKKDKIYHLGDVAIDKKQLKTLDRLNGQKVLVLGNHDIFPATDYLKYFVDIKGYLVYDRLIFSHIPIHQDSKGRFQGNIHGHTHCHRMLNDGIVDSWYQNMCVEVIDYMPVPFDDLKKIINFESLLYGNV